MNHRRVRIAAQPDPAPAQHAPDQRQRRRLALVVTSTSAMLAGLAVGYALGLQQSFQRALEQGEHDGV
jgi:hypothetical protein